MLKWDRAALEEEVVRGTELDDFSCYTAMLELGGRS